jgi:hypothetical protein
MAVGFPTKTTFTDGSTLAAADLNDITGTLNSLVDGTSALAWTPYTPTLAGGWSVGNGTYSAYYAQIGKTVFVNMNFNVGSTTVKGVGAPIFGIPVTATHVQNQSFPARYTIAGTAYDGVAILGFSYGFYAFAINSAGTYALQVACSSTVPATWTTADIFSFQLVYEAA